jgi:hypothetical protein
MYQRTTLVVPWTFYILDCIGPDSYQGMTLVVPDSGLEKLGFKPL